MTAPFVRIPAVIYSKNQSWHKYIEDTEYLSAKNVIKLALRTFAVVIAVFTTLVAGVISPKLAIKIQELLGILDREEWRSLEDFVSYENDSETEESSDGI